MRALDPDVLHFYEREAVSFQVVDCPGGNTARGDYPGGIPGAVRPLLRWTTTYERVDAVRDDLPAA
jgi:lipopolysaccharide transport system ATP-binding protein